MAFDNMLLEAQLQSLLAIGLPPGRVASYLGEQLQSSVFARLGDVEVGPLPHSRGKQGGCGTPFVFNAVLTHALAGCLASWDRRFFGIKLPASPARVASTFSCGVFADNLVLAGTHAQVVTMYTEATSRTHSLGLR